MRVWDDIVLQFGPAYGVRPLAIAAIRDPSFLQLGPVCGVRRSPSAARQRRNPPSTRPRVRSETSDVTFALGYTPVLQFGPAYGVRQPGGKAWIGKDVLQFGSVCGVRLGAQDVFTRLSSLQFGPACGVKHRAGPRPAAPQAPPIRPRVRGKTTLRFCIASSYACLQFGPTCGGKICGRPAP